MLCVQLRSEMISVSISPKVNITRNFRHGNSFCYTVFRIKHAVTMYICAYIHTSSVCTNVCTYVHTYIQMNFRIFFYWSNNNQSRFKEFLRIYLTATKAACEMFAKAQNPHTVAELHQALEECSKYHGQLTKEAAMGNIMCSLNYTQW